MTDQELINLFYEDIKNSAEPSWWDNLCNLEEATYQEFFLLLPEPIRTYAFAEHENDLDDETTLRDLFDEGFTWSDAKHGKIWQRLFRVINAKLDGKHVDLPTNEELLSL